MPESGQPGGRSKHSSGSWIWLSPAVAGEMRREIGVGQVEVAWAEVNKASVRATFYLCDFGQVTEVSGPQVSHSHYGDN